MGVFNLVFHHGGSFVQDGHTYYRGGSETTVEGQDEDKWSFFEAVSLVKDWGYEGFRLWRKTPQTDEGFTNVVDDAGAVEVAKHCMSCRVHNDLWVEHGVEDMMTKVLVPNVDDFSTSSGDDSTGDYVDASQCFNDSEEERVIDVEEEQFEQVEVAVPVSGNRVEIEGKSFRFKRCASKDPKKMKEKSKRDKVRLLVPKSVLGSCSKRATRKCEDVDYASEELESSDADESDMDDKPSKPKKCQAKEQDPNALKRKRKTPRTKVSKKSDGTVDEGPEMDTNVDTTATGGGTVDEGPEMDALLNNMMDLYEEQQSQVDNHTQPTAMQPPPTHESQPAAMQPPPTHDSQPAAMQPDPAATNVKKPSARKKVVAVPWK
ncbi:unnamed protein product [Vicia faba]|uniref:PB1-like domain-containing protein n=1 Tax=Vicia faba TaxID=3906 RepID=A0AAV0ZBL8_VICFA|nr:unnamed protein product [Vicia faba]